MKSYAIVAVKSNLTQQNEDHMLCIFSTREDAESYLKLAGRPAYEVYIVECEVKRWREAYTLDIKQ